MPSAHLPPLRSSLRWLAALLPLEGLWAIACEALRERAPLALVGFALGPWALALWAHRALLPRGARATLALALALLALDVALDLWIPYRARFLHARWELARLAPLAYAAPLAARAHSRAALLAARAVRAATLLACALVALTVALLAATGARDATASADAALVLGFSLDAQGRPQPSLVARVEHGAALYRRGLVPYLVLSGGAEPGKPSEASVMRELARRAGVPDAALVLEERSRSTDENFRYAAPLLRDRGARAVLLVTEPYHMPRALLLARRYGAR